MKKGIIIFILCLIVLLVACTQQPAPDSNGEPTVGPNDTSEPSEEEVSSDQEESGPIVDTLANILKLGGKYRCTMTSQGVQSTIYVSGENSRVETEVSTGQKTYAISKKMPDGKICTFSWSVGGDIPINQAIKLCVDPQEVQTTTTQEPAQTSSDIDVECSPYLGTIDLNPPANLEVLDIGSINGQVVAVIPVED